MSNVTVSITSVTTDMSTITGLLAAVLAILLAGVAAFASRYIPEKYLNFAKKRIGRIQTFVKDPAATMQSTLNSAVSDPSKALRDISQLISEVKGTDTEQTVPSEINPSSCSGETVK